MKTCKTCNDDGRAGGCWRCGLDSRDVQEAEKRKLLQAQLDWLAGYTEGKRADQPMKGTK